MELFGFGTRSDHENHARGVSSADCYVVGVRGAVEVVPLPQPPLVLVDNQRALTGQDEKPLLRVLQ